MIEALIIVSVGYSRKCSWRQCKIQLSRDNLGEQKLLESVFSGFQTAQNPKFWQPWCYLRDILGLLQNSRFELLDGWNVCESQISLRYYFKIGKATVCGTVEEVCEAIWKRTLKAALKDQNYISHLIHSWLAPTQLSMHLYFSCEMFMWFSFVFIISISIKRNSKSIVHVVNFFKLVLRVLKTVSKNKKNYFKALCRWKTKWF